MSHFDCIVFDIGGTTMRSGVFTASRRLLKPVLSRHSPSFLSYPDVSTARLQRLLLDCIFEAVEQMRLAHRGRALRHISIAVPGPVTREGVIRNAPPLWGRGEKAMPLKALVEKNLRVNCLVVNDMTAAAARYASLEQFRSHRLICVVTVSSGVGNKVFDVQTMEPLLDSKGISGELGHVSVSLPTGVDACDCGKRGHLSAIASGRGAARFAQYMAQTRPRDFSRSILSQWTNREAKRITAEHLAAGAKIGDRFVLSVLGEVTLPLAHALNVLVGSVGIEKIIIVGGFALGVGPPYLRALRNNWIRLGSFGRTSREIQDLLTLGAADDYSGLIGAGILVQSGVRPSVRV